MVRNIHRDPERLLHCAHSHNPGTPHGVSLGEGKQRFQLLFAVEHAQILFCYSMSTTSNSTEDSAMKVNWKQHESRKSFHRLFYMKSTFTLSSSYVAQWQTPLSNQQRGGNPHEMNTADVLRGNIHRVSEMSPWKLCKLNLPPAWS